VRATTFLLAAILLTIPAGLSGQRMSCARADSVLRSETRARQKGGEALGALLLNCRDSSVAIVTALLRQLPTRSTGDELAIAGAAALLVPEMLDSVVALSKDAQQSMARRTLYLALLTRYADCRFGLDRDALGRSHSHVIFLQLDACDRDGRHALSFVDRDHALVAIAWISQHDPDGRVRELAREASEEILYRWEMGAKTPSSP
jgi:hypothetical protein